MQFKLSSWLMSHCIAKAGADWKPNTHPFAQGTRTQIRATLGTKSQHENVLYKNYINKSLTVFVMLLISNSIIESKRYPIAECYD